MELEQKNKVLYIIAGANGSGKSTLAQVLLQFKNIEFLNADEIAKEIAPNAINSVPITAGKMYFRRLKAMFDKNCSFAVETTLSGVNIIKIINQAKKRGYLIKLIYTFLDSCTTCIERVHQRVRNGGHSVPEGDIVRRYYKSIDRFWNDYRFMVDEWSLFYNGYKYSPVLVSYGISDNYDIINLELQQKFEQLIFLGVNNAKY